MIEVPKIKNNVNEIIKIKNSGTNTMQRFIFTAI